MISHYLIDIIFLLLAAVIAVPIFQAIKLGAVPGFLISGVIVGPSGLGLIDNIDEISHLAEIGVVLLLFVIGVELKPSRLWKMRSLVFGLGTLQVSITGLLISLGCYYLFNIPIKTAILIGPALALSSTAFVIQLLNEQKQLKSEYGNTAFSVLLLQDLAVVPLLLLVPLLTLSDLSVSEDIGLALIESLVILTLIILVGKYLLHPLLHRVALSGNSEIFTASAVLIVLGTALITEHIGLSMAMGAFLAGLLLSNSSYRHQVIAEIQPFRGLLLGLFFISMGMSLNLQLLIDNPVSSLAIMIVLIVLKVSVLFPLVLLFGMSKKISLAVALILAQSGEFALVLFSLAYQSELMTEILFQQLLLIVLLSMLVTPILAYFAFKLSQSTNKKTENTKTAIDNKKDIDVVIAGFGRVGHRIGEILTLAKVPFVALDYDAKIVEQQRQKGFPVYYGDVCKPELLKSAGAHKAGLIIVTINQAEITQQVVSTLKNLYPKTTIYARGHNMNQCHELRKLGASAAVSENVEASLELARLALINIEYNKTQLDSILNEFRHTYRAQIDANIDS